jgi:mono/diheme cytochrome c family protein
LVLAAAIGFMLPMAMMPADTDKKVGDGEAVYKKNCNMCHYPDKADKKLGPGLKDLFKNKELPESHRSVSDAVVRDQIENGSKKMPGFGKKLSSDDIDNLMAYLKTL